MSSGLPVITTRSNGASGIIDNGVNGYILDEPDNIKQLISYIKNLSKKEQRNKLALAAANKMLDFTKEKNNQKMLDIYQEIVKNKNK